MTGGISGMKLNFSLPKDLLANRGTTAIPNPVETRFKISSEDRVSTLI